MKSVFTKKPKMKEKNSAIYIIIVSILTIVSIVPLLTPVIVCLFNGFTGTDGTADNVYYILRGLFGVSLVIGTTAYAVNKDISAAAVPSLFGFAMLLFPLYENVATLTDAIETANKLSMTMDYTLYILNVGEYLFLTLLCLFTALFSLGLFRNVIIIMLLSVVSSLAALFIAIDQHVTFQISTYEILCFAYAVPTALIPTFLALSVKPRKKKAKYDARRMKS